MGNTDDSFGLDNLDDYLAAETAAAQRRQLNDSVALPRFIAGDVLAGMRFPPIKYVVPGYVVEGLTLFAGKPKIGKSWLCLEMAVAVSDGGYCLGDVLCEQGQVLYLGLEDNGRRLQSRLHKLLPDTEADRIANIDFVLEAPRSNDGGIEMIREWIESKPNPRLVIIDVLAMFRPVRSGSDNSYETDYAAIKALQALASEMGVAIVVVHHLRKGASDSGDPFEKVSGTLGLSGAADSVIVLDRDNQGITLYLRGRDVEEKEVAVTFDKLSARWIVQGAITEVRRSDERGAILHILKGATEPLSPSDISALTEIKVNNIKQLLFKMLKTGEVEKAGRGRYVHPDNSSVIGTPSRAGNFDNRDNFGEE